jgi:hypothetical protein
LSPSLYLERVDFYLRGVFREVQLEMKSLLDF